MNTWMQKRNRIQKLSKNTQNEKKGTTDKEIRKK